MADLNLTHLYTISAAHKPKQHFMALRVAEADGGTITRPIGRLRLEVRSDPNYKTLTVHLLTEVTALGQHVRHHIRVVSLQPDTPASHTEL